MTEWRSGPIRWEDMPRTPVVDGITAASLTGAHLSASVFELEPHAVVPPHAHSSEEFGYVVAGALRMQCGDGPEFVANAGDTFYVAPDTPHHALALEHGCRLLECYSPPRVPAPKAESPTS